MLPKQDIEKYGGKGAILNYIREKLPNMPVPFYVIKEQGSSLDSVLNDFKSMKKPVLVRSSSPYEYGDFEGIFESVKDVYNESSLEQAIKKVEESAKSDRVKIYAKQNGFKIEEKIHTIIQEQSDSRYCGAIMRHPNNPDLIFITYFSGRKKYKQDYDSFLFDEKTQSMEYNRVFCSSDYFQESDAKFLVEKYKEIEGLKEITSDHSLFVEFGHSPFSVYQARPFKKVETADFEIPDFKFKEDIWSDFVFGITPPEGMVLPIVKSIGSTDAFLFGSNRNFLENLFKKHDGILARNIYASALLNNLGIETKLSYLNKKLEEWLFMNEGIAKSNSYCLLTTSAKNEEYNIDLAVPNMQGLIIGSCENFLVHNLVRLFKKAEVTVGVPVLYEEELYKNLCSHQDKIRIISNGKEAIVSKE